MKEGKIYFRIMKWNKDGRFQDFPNYSKSTQIKNLVHLYLTTSTSQCPAPSALGRAMKILGVYNFSQYSCSLLWGFSKLGLKEGNKTKQNKTAELKALYKKFICLIIMAIYLLSYSVLVFVLIRFFSE